MYLRVDSLAAATESEDLMGSDPSTPRTEFRDDDPFLLKYLPGTDTATSALRHNVYTLNTDNLDLIRFVALIGPTGTGKNHLARVCAGHRRWLDIQNSKEQLDPGKDFTDRIAPLEKYTTRLGDLMLSSVQEALAESTLFGHVRGAFTGADKNSPGLFGDDGYDDILLDEIGEAPLVLQAKLLAILEGRPFTPVGGSSKDRKVCDKRIFMATNRDLPEMVKLGTFREDLFYRVRRHTVALNRLSDVPSTIPSIAAAIIERLCPRKFRDAHGRPPVLSAADYEWMKNQQWDGNVRELEEVIELWLSEACPPDIRKVAEARHFAGQRLKTRSTTQDVTAAVRTKIAEIISDRRKPPGTISKFVEEFTGDISTQVSSALHAWYREEKPSPESLRRLFPDMELTSVRTQMSRIGRQE
jgi:Sigma-54 interaction domain